MSDLIITQQKQDNQQMLLTIEVPDDRVQAEMRKTAKRVAKQYRFPGFRPGKAPYHVVVSRVGREAILEDTAEHIGANVYKEAIESVDIDAYGSGMITDVSFDPLTYQVEIPLPPEVDANNYRDIRVAFEEPTEEALAEAIDEQINAIREQHKVWNPSDGPIQYGDLVTISLKISVNDEVVLENDEWDFIPDEEEYTLAPEFDEQFVDSGIGESTSFDLTFPEDGDSAWPGELGHFEVEIKSLKREELPEVNDDLAKELGEEYESWAAVETAIISGIEENLSNQAETEHRSKTLEAMVEEATLVYPPAAVNREIDMLASERDNLYRSYGFESTEELLKMQGRTMEEYVEDLRPEAEERLKVRLVLGDIAEKEAFAISEYELDQYLLRALGPDSDSLEEIRSQVQEDEDYREFLTSMIRRERAQDLVIAIAKGEDVPAPGEHPLVEAPPEPEVAPEEVDEVETVEIEAGVDIVVGPEETTEVTETEPGSEATSQTEEASEVTLETDETTTAAD